MAKVIYDRLPSNLAREMDEAERLFGKFGETVQNDKGLRQLIHLYRIAIRENSTKMEALGVVAECSACAQENPGSCCFQEVEEWYCRRLLFINLVMGCEMPRHREVPGYCLFVGEKGCKLIARHAFCVNYLCPRLKRRLRPAGTALLSATAGYEVGCGWELEQALVQRLKD